MIVVRLAEHIILKRGNVKIREHLIFSIMEQKYV